MPIRCTAPGRSGASARSWPSTASAWSSRPACSCSLATANSRSSRSAADGSAAAGPGAGMAGVGTGSANRIAQPRDDRLQDRDRRLQLFQVMPVAVARAVVERLGHLGVAGGAGIAAVVVEIDAAFVEFLADEGEHPAHAGFQVADDV